MNLSEFQNKDVININNGKKIGNIVDYIIEPINGNIISLLVVPFKGVFSLKGSQKLEIDYKNISKIGEDVILINYKD